MANSVFSIEDAQTVSVTSRALLMSGPAISEAGGGYPILADSQLLAGTFHDTLVKVNDQWLIQKRVGSIELQYR